MLVSLHMSRDGEDVNYESKESHRV